MRWIVILFSFLWASASSQTIIPVNGDYDYPGKVHVYKALTVPNDTLHAALNGSLAVKNDRCFYFKVNGVWRKVFCDTSGTITPTALAILSNPSNQTVTVGSSASFTATATGGTTPYTHQWQKGTTNISGATSGTYTIGSTITGDAGTYRDVITDAVAASVISASATLTVNTTTIIRAVYGYVSTDPYVDNSTVPSLGTIDSTVITHNADLSINFPSSAVDKFLVFKVPSTESTKVTWFVESANTGSIPDAAFRAPFTIGGYTYYVTRDAAGFTFNYTLPVQLKQ
jgi:hypothetical protein